MNTNVVYHKYAQLKDLDGEASRRMLTDTPIMERGTKSLDTLTERAIQLTFDLLAIPSVSGDCERILKRVESELASLGLIYEKTNKGAILARWEGQDDEHQRVVTAHVDTLGAAVRHIRENGRLRLYPIGGFDWRSFEGENCTVHTLEGKEYRGTLLPDKAACQQERQKDREQESEDKGNCKDLY